MQCQNKLIWHAGGHGVRALAGGLPPAVPLWSLKLALQYCDSGLGLAAASVAEQRAADSARPARSQTRMQHAARHAHDCSCSCLARQP